MCEAPSLVYLFCLECAHLYAWSRLPPFQPMCVVVVEWVVGWREWASRVVGCNICWFLCTLNVDVSVWVIDRRRSCMDSLAVLPFRLVYSMMTLQ